MFITGSGVGKRNIPVPGLECELTVSFKRTFRYKLGNLFLTGSVFDFTILGQNLLTNSVRPETWTPNRVEMLTDWATRDDINNELETEVKIFITLVRLRLMNLV